MKAWKSSPIYAAVCVSGLLSFLIASACSLLNRQGPDVTCTELYDGAINACEEGIIATCIGGNVHYAVCDDPNACQEPWQLAGAYRCSTGDPPAVLVNPASDPTAPQGPASTPAPLPVSPGPNPAPSTPAPSNEAACDPRKEPCAVVSTTGNAIEWFTLDQELIYFADCSTVWSVSKMGGFPTVLASTVDKCSLGVDNVVQDDTTLFFIRGMDLFRLSKTGGVAQKVPGATAWALASDDTHVYWIDWVDNTLKSMTTSGDIPQTLAEVKVSSYRTLAEHRGYLYWLSSDGLARIPTSGPSPAAASTLPLGTSSTDFLAADTGIYFISSARNSIGKVDPESGLVTTIATGQSGVFAITADDDHLYWINGGSRAELRKLSVAGGAVTTIAWLSGAGARNSIATDEQYVYWSQGSKLMRVVK